MAKQTRLRPDIESQPPAAPLPPGPSVDSASTVLGLIERVALDPGVGAEKLDRIMAIYGTLKAKEAELAYNAAKGRILKKLVVIKIVKNRSALNEVDNAKPQKGTHEAFKYAPLEEIDRHLRPLLAEEEMDLSYSDEPAGGGGIRIRGRLRHLPGGYHEDFFMSAPPDTTGGKSSVQALGSTNSYLRRYVACNIFNIVVVGDDDDGNGGTIDEAQSRTILALIKKSQSRTEVSQIHEGAERRGSWFSQGCRRDDCSPGLPQGNQHSQRTDSQSGGRSCRSSIVM
jgi:hypothetical protein